jgi:hypothetical protein
MEKIRKNKHNKTKNTARKTVKTLTKHDDALSTYQSGYNLTKPVFSSHEFNRKDIAGQRLRYATTNLNAQAVSSTAIVPIFTLPQAQGSQEGQRTGDSISLKGLEINMLMNYETLAVIAPSSIRFIIIQVIAASAPLTAPQILDVGSSASIDLTSLYIPFARGKAFHVLYDKIFHMNPYGNAGQIFERLKLAPKIGKLSFLPGTVNLETGGFYQMLLISDSNAVPHPTISLSARTWYLSS